MPKAGARFVAKMEDVLDVYARPYDPESPVVCVDEKSKELPAQVREPMAAQRGQVRKQDAEYHREGTANIFLWVEPLAGCRGSKVTERRGNVDFAELLRDLADALYPTAKTIVLVVDNLNTHGPHCVYERFVPAEARRLAQRFDWHYTPEHGSWLNIAECELSVLACQCTNRRIGSHSQLRHAVAAWQTTRNAHSTKIHWHFTTTDSRIKLRHLYPQPSIEKSS
ncbi:MAG: IS630 family transposase [Deltaproteobacteria bacterium]|nr:IS630 family transposase [Deltaproteobacteria bacterium]